MKRSTTILIGIIAIQAAVILGLILRARAQENRLVAASATAIACFRYSEALRAEHYGDYLAGADKAKIIQNVNEIHKNGHEELLWYEWARSYCYAVAPPRKMPSLTPSALAHLDMLALPNFFIWVNEAHFASDSSRRAFEYHFDNYVEVSNYLGELECVKSRPSRNYGDLLMFNLPSMPSKSKQHEEE